MNRLILIMLCLANATAWASKPEPIYSFATILKPVNWYKEQVALWKQEIDKNPQNAEAWYNYYRASRSVNRLDTIDVRTGKQRQEDELRIVNEMEKVVPESYEYNLCRWLINGNNYAYVSYLKKAEQLAGTKTQHYSDMITWGEVERNQTRKLAYAQKWYSSGEASPGLLYYNYNVLAGLKPNAIIFTTGDNDTYPIWLLQSQGIRKDVTVLNVNLLFIDEYRNKIFKELGVPAWNMLPESYSINDKGLADDVSDSTKKANRFNTEIVKHVAANSKKYPVYVGLTVSEEYTKPISADLFLTGLAFEYSLKGIDNMAYLKINFEQNYALDYLDKQFFTDISESVVSIISSNYLVPMIKLYEHYNTSGETQKAVAIKQKALNIAKNQKAKGCNYMSEDQISTYFK